MKKGNKRDYAKTRGRLGDAEVRMVRGRWRDKGTGGKGKGLPPNPKCVDCGVEKNDDNTRKNGDGRYESYCRVCKRHRTAVYKSRISTINRLRGI